jgi:transcriptional regulator with XRE-family HTH domain
MLPAESAALPPTLAQRVQVLRERMGWTTAALAQRAIVTVEELDDIEQGMVLFLSAHVRQKLAKTLRVPPAVLQAVEIRPLENETVGPPAQQLSALDQIELLEWLANEPVRYIACPQCGTSAQVLRFERRDGHGHVLHAIKVRCPACWFKLDHG